MISIKLCLRQFIFSFYIYIYKEKYIFIYFLFRGNPPSTEKQSLWFVCFFSESVEVVKPWLLQGMFQLSYTIYSHWFQINSKSSRKKKNDNILESQSMALWRVRIWILATLGTLEFKHCNICISRFIFYENTPSCYLCVTSLLFLLLLLSLFYF